MEVGKVGLLTQVVYLTIMVLRRHIRIEGTLNEENGYICIQ